MDKKEKRLYIKCNVNGCQTLYIQHSIKELKSYLDTDAQKVVKIMNLHNTTARWSKTSDNEFTGYTPLIFAIQEGKQDAVKCLFKK